MIDIVFDIMFVSVLVIWGILVLKNCHKLLQSRYVIQEPLYLNITITN